MSEDDESGLESKSESQIPSNVGNEYSESETLNSPITEDEVSKAVKRLKIFFADLMEFSSEFQNVIP